MDEQWKHKIEAETRKCLEDRVRLEEQTKSQQKEIDESWKQISELYDYKNNIFQKITGLEAQKVGHKDFNALAKCVTQLKTERKFLPYLVMIVTLIGTIASVVYLTLDANRGKDADKPRSQTEISK
jgi:hypothetical protein